MSQKNASPRSSNVTDTADSTSNSTKKKPVKNATTPIAPKVARPCAFSTFSATLVTAWKPSAKQETPEMAAIYEKQFDPDFVSKTVPSIESVCAQNQTGDFVNSAKGKHVYWNATNCQLISQDNTNDLLSTLKDFNIYFVGNSHIRNLFRCSADYISGGLSWSKSTTQQNAKCTIPATTMLQSDFGKHAPSCGNMYSNHDMDYDYYDATSNMKLHGRWGVTWQVDLDKRKKCMKSSKSVFPNDDQSHCLLGSDLSYTSPRLIVDLIRGELTRAFVEDPNAFMVFNHYQPEHIEWIARIMDNIMDKNGISMKQRSIHIVEPQISGPPNSFKFLADIQALSITVLDLRNVFKGFVNEPHQQDSYGSGVYNGHLLGPLQRILVNEVLNVISIKRRQIQDGPDVDHDEDSDVNDGDDPDVDSDKD